MLVSARVAYILLLTLAHVFANSKNITESCINLYEKGVEAYLDNRFDVCVTNLENAVEKYRVYTKKLQNCRLKCRDIADLSEPLYPVDVDNLLFYEKAIKTTLCIVKCKRKHRDVFSGFNINQQTEKLFEEQKPYEYLHICYFQNKQLQKAASSAFTYLVSHPDDEVMLSNLKYYATMEGVDMTEVVNFEAKDYVYLYLYGVDAYEKKDWKTAIENMEESLISYLQSEEECRAQCEGPFDQGWYPDLIPSIANHFTFSLRCKQACRGKLSSLNGEKHDDLLPSHYHYLQYAYFKTGNLRAACASVSSYLLFYPTDDTMLINKEYYRNLPKGNDDLFTARPEAVHYVQRHMYEQRLMKFIFAEFNFSDMTKDVIIEAIKYRVIMTEKHLKGPNRFVSESLATVRECRTLVSMAKMFAILGDGYHGKKSPHSAMEQFTGVTINRAVLLVYFGLLDPKHLELLLKITTDARQKVQDYFRLKNELYFTYTHLVCRSALPDSPKNRSDYSHAIHADNCNAFDDTTCQKSAPSFTWRDYSAIIYLNSDFDGGEFIFSADLNAENIQSVVQPKCGRMVAFSSGGENLHGVQAVKEGSRCAIGIWFTFQQEYEETERIVAQQLVDSLKNV